jgi:hypothetical protein
VSEVNNTPVAVLNMPKSDALLIPYAEGIRDSLLNNAFFPSPDPPMLIFTANIDAYKTSQAIAMKKGQGSATQRNSKRRKVIANLRHLCDYVQSVIENYPADEAAAMIVSAGLYLKQLVKRAKAALSARNGDTSGVALLDAKAFRGVAMYYWQYSLDQKVWINIPEMMKASAVVSGLTPLTTYYFRFRTTTRKGPGDYSQVVSLLVL